MTSRRFAWVASAFILGVVAVLSLVNRALVRTTSGSLERPRLVVLLVFDQMRGDYLTRWRDLFEDGGLRRLEDRGAWFQNCHYPYAYTVTGAGHASLATGCTPAVHGIVGNDWYDRQTGKPSTAYRANATMSGFQPMTPTGTPRAPPGGKKGAFLQNGCWPRPWPTRSKRPPGARPTSSRFP